jgi:hypothetical protein
VVESAAYAELGKSRASAWSPRLSIHDGARQGPRLSLSMGFPFMALATLAHERWVRTSEYRAGLALAEAIIPGSKKIPAGDEATYARSMEVLQDFHPTIVTAFNAGVRALDTAAVAFTGKRFHALDAHRQEELLLRWQTTPVLKTLLSAVSHIYKFVHFDRPAVYGTLGGKLNVVKSLEEPRWLSQVHRADAYPDDEIECEVVVVGTGAGGGVVGRELAERGFAVVFVEEGEHHRRDAFDGRAVEAHKRFYRGAFTVGNSPMPIFMGRLLGGSTAINGGTALRTPPWVLERWCEEIGTDVFSPEAMDPYFRRVESFLHIAPSPLDIIGPISGFVARGCDALGWSHQAIPRNAPGCDGKGFCNLGCRTDARLGTNLSYVPAALSKGALCLTGARASTRCSSIRSCRPRRRRHDGQLRVDADGAAHRASSAGLQLKDLRRRGCRFRPPSRWVGGRRKRRRPPVS